MMIINEINCKFLILELEMLGLSETGKNNNWIKLFSFEWLFNRVVVIVHEKLSKKGFLWFFRGLVWYLNFYLFIRFTFHNLNFFIETVYFCFYFRNGFDQGDFPMLMQFFVQIYIERVVFLWKNEKIFPLCQKSMLCHLSQSGRPSYEERAYALGCIHYTVWHYYHNQI